MIPYPRGLGSCHAVHLILLTGDSSSPSASALEIERSSISGLPLEVLVFMSINALDTLFCMLEGGMSSVLDVIEVEGGKYIGSGSQDLDLKITRSLCCVCVR